MTIVETFKRVARRDLAQQFQTGSTAHDRHRVLAGQRLGIKSSTTAFGSSAS
jgi:hypothetical protein